MRGVGAQTDPAPPRNECCVPAPPVMERDAQGNLLHAWGGPGRGHPWRENEHGITVDAQANVWLAGNGPKDGMVLKFTRAGKQLLTIGQPGVVGNGADTAQPHRPSNTGWCPEASCGRRRPGRHVRNVTQCQCLRAAAFA